MRNKEEIKKEYETNIKTYRNAIEVWSKVKRVSKKDGSDFANLGKNFINANVTKPYSWSDELQISVSHCYGDGGYTHDSIDIEDKDTVDVIFNKILNRIEMYKKYISDYEKKLSNIDYVFDEVDRAMEELTKFAKDCGFSSYEICDYIKDNCWRL